MSRGTRIRLIAFAVLSAVGITYITASYLGFIDKVLGRGITVHASLPTSGGLFEGSEVSYRGVKIGKVTAMRTGADGVDLELSLVEGTKLPKDAPMFVHNLSAVGEQYLDFEPADDEGPYVEDGDRLEGSEDSLPTDEADLLVDLNAFVNSVDEQNLQVTVAELGDMFADTGQPLQDLLDNGSTFIDEASAHTDETIALLDNGKTVLSTQQDNAENIRSFSHDLRLLTAALAGSDKDLRAVLGDTPGAVREVDALLKDLEPTLPVLLTSAVSINQVMVTHLNGLEQLLVTFPRTIAGGFTGTTRDGYGHVNLQYDSDVNPCTEGYKPPSQWRQGNDLTDGPIYPAQCRSGRPYVARGTKYSPGYPANSNPARAGFGSGSASDVGNGVNADGIAVGTYDPSTGLLPGFQDADGNAVRIVDPGDLSLLGDDSWKWLIYGPVS